jgi:hypothetical protein
VDKPEPDYIEDYRKTNPDLHQLYTKWAVRNLAIIDQAIHRLCDIAQVTMVDMVTAMQAERQKLIDNHASYADADEILKSVRAVDACPYPKD